MTKSEIDIRCCVLLTRTNNTEAILTFNITLERCGHIGITTRDVGVQFYVKGSELPVEVTKADLKRYDSSDQHFRLSRKAVHRHVAFVQKIRLDKPYAIVKGSVQVTATSNICTVAYKVVRLTLCVKERVLIPVFA